MGAMVWEVLVAAFGVRRALEIICGLEALYIAERVRKQIGMLPEERLKRILELLDEIASEEKEAA